MSCVSLAFTSIILSEESILYYPTLSDKSVLLVTVVMIESDAGMSYFLHCPITGLVLLLLGFVFTRRECFCCI